jgi:splicing suppressor protein 51
VVQGEGFEITKTLGASVKFTGKSLSLQETNMYYLTLYVNGQKELYYFDTPRVNVCNLVFGEPYAEPVGLCTVKNHTTGDVCELDFKARGWTAKSREIVQGVVKDGKGVKRLSINGRYTESLLVTDIGSNQTVMDWKAPEITEKADQMFFFNKFTLQLNIRPDSLMSKLPPTDSRRRMDTQFWENFQTN